MKRSLEETATFEKSNKMQAQINPFTGRQYSRIYYKILETRQKLPVYEARDSFLKLVEDNQIVLLVGETGSGKTTQVRYHHSPFINFC